MEIRFKYLSKLVVFLNVIIFFIIFFYDFSFKEFWELKSREVEAIIIVKVLFSILITYIVMLFFKKLFIKNGSFKIENDKVYLNTVKDKLEIDMKDIFMVELYPSVFINSESLILILTYNRGKKMKLKSPPHNPDYLHDSPFFIIYQQLKYTDKFNEYISTIDANAANIMAKRIQTIERDKWCLKRK